MTVWMLDSDEMISPMEIAEPEPNTGCYLWPLGTTTDGYGVFQLRGRKMYAHRWSYLVAFGHLPEGVLVLHKCDTPACVNPDHLFLGSQKDNMDDASNKGRIRNRQMSQTHCIHGHPLSGNNLYVYGKTGHRGCKTCRRERTYKSRERLGKSR